MLLNPVGQSIFAYRLARTELERKRLNGEINDRRQRNGEAPLGPENSALYEVARDGVHGLGTSGKIAINEGAKFVGSTVTYGLWEPGDLIAYSEWDRQNEAFEFSQYSARIGFELLGLAATAGGSSGKYMAKGVKFGVHGLVPKLGSPRLYEGSKTLARLAGFEVCFAAGTPIRVPGGWKAIEEVAVGECVLSRDEFAAAGAVESKVVEEVFVRAGLVWHLHVGGQVIRTTAEHPFYRRAETAGEAVGEWVAANRLNLGDWVLTEGGRWAKVDDVLDTGEWETVYNVRVADHHTYFVGAMSDGSAVWVHNAKYATTFFNKHPSLIGLVKIHHAIEQQVLKRFPGYFTKKEMHHINNLRGIPNGKNNKFHLGDLRKIWNNFYKKHPNATKDDIVSFADIIDRWFPDNLIR